MRFVLAMALAGLVALPLNLSAQAGEQVEASEPDVVEAVPTPEPAPEEPPPSPETAPEEPALQLKLDDAGLELAPSPPRTPEDGYTLEQMELRVKRARIGLIVSAGVYVLGFAVGIPGAAGDCNNIFVEYLPDRCQPLLVTGSVLTFLGVVGMITSGVMLAKRKRNRAWVREAHYGTPHRAQWDLARSRLVF